MSKKLAVRLGQFADKGVKAEQQDFHGAGLPEGYILTQKGIVCAIADGISSSNVSHIASETAVSSFIQDYYSTPDSWSVKTSAERVIRSINSWLYSQTQQSQGRFDKDRGYVCTFSSLVLKYNQAYLFHIGDARIYRIQNGVMEQLTTDHRISLSSQQSYLSRALGVEAKVEFDYVKVQVYPEDIFLLMTDGAYEHLNQNIILKKIEETEVQKLFKLEESMKSVIFGQNSAIETVVSSIKRARAGLNDDNKPIASLLFVGRTGVGKTELAKQLSKNMDIPIIRYDMSEYQEKHSVAKLIGTAPGYVGYEQGGLLIDAVRKNPHAVLLLDEIEKAHSDIYNILLQIMDYATLTENSGRKADFRNIILIMTSNAGASDSTKLSVGFGGAQYGEGTIENAIKSSFSPEFRNRLNKVVVFNPLNEEMAKEIVKDKLKKFLKLLENKGIEIEVKPEVFDFITKKAFSIVFGAREIERFIDKNIKDKFVDLILFGKTDKKVLEIENNEIIIKDKL